MVLPSWIVPNLSSGYDDLRRRRKLLPLTRDGDERDLGGTYYYLSSGECYHAGFRPGSDPS